MTALQPFPRPENPEKGENPLRQGLWRSFRLIRLSRGEVQRQTKDGGHEIA
jgi:hypothetical protein